MNLSYCGIKDKEKWESAGVTLPKFDIQEMLNNTNEEPQWVHFGSGNIFRAFIARISQKMINQNLTKSGIITVETFDYEIIEKAYKPYDNLSLFVGLKPDGTTDMEIIASVAETICADSSDEAQWGRLCEIFKNPTLRLASFTITEKGYVIRDLDGTFLPVVENDINGGLNNVRHVISIITALLYERYLSGAMPIAVVSMDNCSKNGEVFQNSVVELAGAWKDKGVVDSGFIRYLKNEKSVSFPWTMIDKITPHPADVVFEKLTKLGIENMATITTGKHTYTAPFVNAEIPEYLVIEDNFPNGKPAVDKVGVYLTDRETVSKTETMKVTTCLNPLHTALAVFGCLLGYHSICDEMKDRDLVELINRIGYKEGIPVVVNPKIINPLYFIKEVIEKRLPNPYIPDTPQRIATDTSQKIFVRYGETIKEYIKDPNLDVKDLVAIPFTIAGWLRYLLAVDDRGCKIPLSPDPMISELKEYIDEVKFGKKYEISELKEILSPILSNKNIIGVDLFEVGLGDKVVGFFAEMIKGTGAVREVLSQIAS